VEEVAEGGVRRRTPELDAQRFGEHGVVTVGKALQIPQALAATEDSQHRHQQQIPSRKPNPAQHPRIWDRPQIIDQVEIGWGRSAFRQKRGRFGQPQPMLTAPARSPVTDFESTLGYAGLRSQGSYTNCWDASTDSDLSPHWLQKNLERLNT